ncbi:MAG: hypothetical protein GY803_03280, partial [Chloroflexi bacterium]|nr:hypothetical protein [Chloroflexota bacterium]
MPVVWTTEQVLSLAPTKHFVKTSRNIAEEDKWLSWGGDGNGQSVRFLWGEFPNKSKPPFQVKIALDELTFNCSCAARRFPCVHGLGLLLLSIANPPPRHPHPEWMSTWIEKRPKRAQAQRKREAVETARPISHDQKRLTAVQTGLQELDLWLQDMIRNGLAAVRNKPAQYWTQMADRLVDAQAGGAAAEVRQMIAIPKQEGEWPEVLLRQIGRLYLLIEGFNHFDTLPLETQADLQTAVGWLPKYFPEELTARGAKRNPKKSASSAFIRVPSSGLRDQWHILGQEIEATGKRHIQRIWL